MEYSITGKGLPVYYESVPTRDRAISTSRGCLLRDDNVEHLHYHNCIELGRCIRGRGCTYVDDRLYAFGEGDIQIVFPLQPHISQSESGVVTLWEWISIDPYKLLLETGMTDIAETRELIEKKISVSGVFSPDEYPVFTRIIGDISRELSDGRPYMLRKCALLLDLLLIELARESQGENTSRRSEPKLDSVLPAIRLVRSNIGDSPSVARLASACGMSLTTFRRAFRQVTGYAPKEFILRNRLLYSEYLLTNTSDGILEIGQRAGFGSVSCFNRGFLKKNGISPSAYRRLAGRE